MTKTKCYAKPIYLMVALALVLSVGIVAVPMGGTVEASPGTDYYVNAATGDDTTGDGSPSKPWKTISHAVANVTAGTSGDPNIIHVAAGLYDVTNNGETFPIIFSNEYVTLVGAGATNTTIDRETPGTGTILEIEADGITVQGFTLDNAQYGIEAFVGGFTVLDNVFSNDTDHDIESGVYVNIDETDRDTDFSFDDVLIEGNEFYITPVGTWGSAVYLRLDVDFDETVTGLSATVGDIEIWDNVFNMEELSDGVVVEFYLYDLNGGTVDIGDVDISDGNEFYGGYDGVYFDSYLNYFTDTTVTVGDFMVNGNTFEDQSDIAVRIEYYYYSYDWLGTTTGTFGDLEITGNDISSDETGSYGIYCDYYAYWEDFYDDASLTAGNVYIEDNDPIDVELDAIYFYYYYTEYLYDDAWITMGDLSIQRNNIQAGRHGMAVGYEVGFYLYGNSALTIGNTYIADNDVDAYQYGIYFGLWYIGYDMDNYATVTFGNITIEGNDVHAVFEAIYFSGPYECGYYLYGNSAVTMGDINIVDNNTGIVSDDRDGIRLNYEYSGYDMYEDSMATFGDVNIEGNIIDAYRDGIYLYYYECAYYMYGNSTATWGEVRIDDNQVASGGNGVLIEHYDWSVGSYNEDDSYARLPGYNITRNTFNVTEDGICFYTYGNPSGNSGNARVDFGGFLIDDNTFSCDRGIYFWIGHVCDTCGGDVVTTMGDVVTADNEFHDLDSEAIYIWYDDVQYQPEDNSTLEVGNLTIAGNLIDGASNGIKVDYDTVYGAMNATTTMGTLDITGNEIGNVTADGIYVSYYLEADDSSTLTVGRALIQDNTLDGSSDDGVYMYMSKDSDAGATLSLGDPVIDDNTIENWQTGIYLEDVESATISNNKIQNNSQGINLDGSSDNQIFGNDILSNVGADSGVHFDADCSGNLVHFNNIVGNGPRGVYNDPGNPGLNATHNWWGCDEGPGAAGCDDVSANVTYAPWLGAPLELPAVHYETLGPGTHVVDASEEADTKVTLNVTADRSETDIYIARYESQPFPGEPFPDKALGKYIDIHVSNPGAVEWPIHVEVGYTAAEVKAAGIDESTLGLYYYKALDTFHRCSDTGVAMGSKFVWADVTEEEAGYLVGTAFGPGGSPLEPPPPVGGEAYPVNKLAILAPWIAVAVLLAGGISWYVLRRRKAQS
jgi:parallel beta-helix repeat protein